MVLRWRGSWKHPKGGLGGTWALMEAERDPEGHRRDDLGLQLTRLRDALLGVSLKRVGGTQVRMFLDIWIY